MVVWELHSICSSVKGKVLKWGNAGDLVKLIQMKTGNDGLRRVDRLYNVWKPEGREPYISFCLAKSLNLTGLLDGGVGAALSAGWEKP